MGFVKVVKTKAYFKRFQPKYRRRREGKTDYRARRNLIVQDKNKYNTPKNRLVVRFTNKDIICQIVSAEVQGDKVLCAAYAHELKRYGMPVGLTNYSAAYATGLLLARRVLAKYSLADKYLGNPNINGEDYNVDANSDGPHPFRAVVDVGLVRTTTGNKVFAAVKGACDGGIDVPHSEKRFVGYDDEGKKLDTEALKKHLFGGHVAEYMKSLKEKDPEAFQARFSKYIKAGMKPEDIEKTWQKVFAAIRKDPSAAKKKPVADKPKKSYKKQRMSLEQRKDRVRQRMANMTKKQESS
jgi:large subunit ribosomal protein L5e